MTTSTGPSKQVSFDHSLAIILSDYYLWCDSITGNISINIDSHWLEPGSDSEADIEAAERVRQFSVGNNKNNDLA